MEAGHDGNQFLVENCYSPRNLESGGSKQYETEPACSRKNFGLLHFPYKQISHLFFGLFNKAVRIMNCML
jgi:hypothetical protein